MKYDTLFNSVQSHLERQGVECQIQVGKIASDKAISKIESKLSIQIPDELKEFYQSVGNGYTFFWEANTGDSRKSITTLLQVPTLANLASMYVGWREMVLYTPEAAEKYGFPYTEDPALAKQTAARMWHWLPVIEEGNGDMFSLDLSMPGGPVIFDRHDWMDGGTGNNGHLLASNFKTFLIAWGGVCFQSPESLYWPSCLRPEGGIDWDNEQFRSPFRVAGLT